MTVKVWISVAQGAILLSSIFWSLSGCKTVQKTPRSEVLGYMGGAKYVHETFVVYKPQPTAEQLAGYIKRETADRDEDPVLPPEELARLISGICLCFGVDAAIMTGVFQLESRFDRTADEGNGTGLGQLTGPAIEEVNDQLGRRGRDNARAEAIEYFNGRVKDCVAPTFGREPWEQLWELASGNSGMRRKTVEDPLYNVLYSVFLLKVYLSLAKTHDSNVDLDDPGEVQSLYREALANYNGVPGIMESYPSNVLGFTKSLKMHMEGTSE